MTTLAKALRFAKKAHEGQVDDEGIAAIMHPIQTAQILELVTTDQNLIAAAYLHDTIEDCGVSYEDLEERFGKDIADLVNEVSHEGQKDDHGYYFPRLHTQRGIMLKFADRLSNISRMGSWNEKRVAQYLQRSKFWRSE